VQGDGPRRKLAGESEKLRAEAEDHGGSAPHHGPVARASDCQDIVDTLATGTEVAPDYELRKGKALTAKHFASFKLGLQNGLASQLVARSDMKYEPDGGSLLDEMIAMVKYGATPQQALAAGTKNGASLTGWGATD
jgi:imidazolonepropionase-like amidohydrolase